MKRLLVSFVAALMLTSVSAQQSSGPVLPAAELAKQQQLREQQQPYNNAPIWQNARGAVVGYTSVPGPETGVLIQDGGQNWRALRNGTVATAGGWAIVAMMLIVGGFYAWRGTIQLHEAPTGRLMDRFSLLERMAHWTTAITFTILAISGLILAFGKTLLIPVFGFTLFSWLAIIAKNLHNFLGPVFVCSILVMFVVFVRDNLPKAIDVKWILSAGGLFSDKHVPSEKFNAGEKIWFWGGMMLLGLVVGISGLVLNFPNFGQTRATMQFANLVHLGVSSLFIVAALGHIYMGTLGVAGALDAMKTGQVDETWAKEHHEVWFEQQIKAGNTGKASTATPNGQHPVAVGGDD
jgi:formate dehydrogenase subunit gamma